MERKNLKGKTRINSTAHRLIEPVCHSSGGITAQLTNQTIPMARAMGY
jgi:hypothetical protein